MCGKKIKIKIKIKIKKNKNKVLNFSYSWPIINEIAENHLDGRKLSFQRQIHNNKERILESGSIIGT